MIRRFDIAVGVINRMAAQGMVSNDEATHGRGDLGLKSRVLLVELQKHRFLFCSYVLQEVETLLGMAREVTCVKPGGLGRRPRAGGKSKKCHPAVRRYLQLFFPEALTARSNPGKFMLWSVKVDYSQTGSINHPS